LAGEVSQLIGRQCLGDPLSLTRRAAIAPDDSPPQGSRLFIHEEMARGLTGQAEGQYLAGADARLFNGRRDGLTRGQPPVCGLLLRPAGVRLIDGVGHPLQGSDLSICGEQCRFQRRGAQI